MKKAAQCIAPLSLSWSIVHARVADLGIRPSRARLLHQSFRMKYSQCVLQEVDTEGRREVGHTDSESW